MPNTLLVTGALGYIGSHTLVELLLSTHFHSLDILAIDNLSNSSLSVLDDIQNTVQQQNVDVNHRLNFLCADVTDSKSMREIFHSQSRKDCPIVAVIHFAALKSVSESLHEPLKYYRENVFGLLTMLTVMQEWDCNTILFSSSATVYGLQQSEDSGDCRETMCRHDSNQVDSKSSSSTTTALSNPYARTKWMCEAILQDASVANPSLQAVALRYFNPVGAHPLGHLRESPRGEPTNLVPCIMRAIERNRPIEIFGTDYHTSDGSAVRDFIHVVDLAQGHVAALQKFVKQEEKCANECPSWLLQLKGSAVSSSSSVSSPSSSILDWNERSPIDTPPTPSSSLFQETRVEDTADVDGGCNNNLLVYNLGTGQGSTVKEVVAAMRLASGHAIPIKEVARRKGDVEKSVANPTKANTELQWYAQKTLADSCRDACRHLQSKKS